jgi:Amino-transferase class IV
MTSHTRHVSSSCSSVASQPISLETSCRSWSCTASIGAQNKTNGRIEIQNVCGSDDEEPAVSDPTAIAPAKHLDLTQSPDWMEYIEVLEQRQMQEGGAGAYDTLRCDLILKNREWNVWGLEFHLDRLQNSYRSLYYAKNGQAAFDKGSQQMESNICQATVDSQRLAETLLEEAKRNIPVPAESHNRGDCDTEIQLFRLTFLWSPKEHDQDGACQAIVVRGHATASTETMEIHSTVQPIVCTVAASNYHTPDATLPCRNRNPQSKVASWTRIRKQMELPSTYKPSGVSEVLMVRKATNGDLELLEGLSSNLFVIYSDNTLRTPAEGVLFGYVRHLVLNCADFCGLSISHRPILLSEASEWKEAFITSSSRLIYPISKILVHDNNDENNDKDDPIFTECWRDPVLVHSDVGTRAKEPQHWQQLLNELLLRAGYPCKD